MKHFAVFNEDLESDRFLSASNDQIATWLFLHGLCSKQLNGGTIKDADSFNDRFWNRHGIDPAIVKRPSPLWNWQGPDLTIQPYDLNGQELYLKKSRGGREGVMKRWANRSENRTPIKTPNTPDQTRPDQTRPDHTIPKRNRNTSQFQKPTLEMVNEYGKSLSPAFTSGSDFIDYYDSNGWKIGSSPMKDWKATVRRWNRNPVNGKGKAPITAPRSRNLRATDLSI